MSQSNGLYQTSDKPALVAYNDTLYLMWKEAGGTGVFTSQSTDHGLTWSPKTRAGAIETPNAPSFVITPDGTKHFAYRGTDSLGLLFYASSTDFVNWTVTQVDYQPASSDTPSLANYNNTLYMIWKGPPTDTQVYYSKRDPDTKIWALKTRVASFVAVSGLPFVIAQDGSQHFACRGQDNGVIYAYRVNDTADWMLYSSAKIGSSSEKPTLAFGSTGLLHLMWKGISGDNTVWHSVGTWNGTYYLFSNQVQINTAIQTDFGVGLTFLSGRYYLAYKGTDVTSPLLWASSVNAQDWQSISRLESYSIDRPALAFSSLNYYLLMWTKSDSSIWRSASYDMDNARLWKPQEQINSLIQAQSGPSLAVSASGLHYLVYQGLNNEVFYSTSTDGDTWSDPSPSLGSTGSRPTIAVSGNTAFIMFKGVGTDNTIYLTTNASGTWSNAASIGQNTLSGPTLLCNGGQTLHIAFRGTDSFVYYGKSDNSGQSWVITQLPLIQLPSPTSTGDSPVLQLYNGKILIFWKGVTGDNQLYYSVCTTQFKDWTPPIQLSQAFKTAFTPAILINNDIVHIAIRGNGTDDCLYHTSGSMDIFWSAPYKITGGNSTDSPSITSYDGNVWAVWKGNGSDVRGWYSVSTTGGNSWGAIVAMNSSTIGMTSVPSVLDWANGTVVNSAPLHFNLIFRASNNNLRYAYSADQTFTTEVISGANSSDGPCSVAYNGKMYVFYKGNSTNTRIYCVIRSWGGNYQYLWNAFQALPSIITTLNKPTAVVSSGSVINLFYRGVDSLIYCAKNSDGGNWSFIRQLPGYTTHAPGATNYDGRLFVVWKRYADNTIWFSRSDVNGINWSDQFLIAGTDTISGPNIAAVNGRLHLVFKKSDSSVYYSMGQDIVNWNLASSIQAMANSSLTSELDNNKLNEIGTPVKICFNQEIHKLSTIPTTYQSLIKTISSMFGDRLPRKWVLSYIDSQGDNIALSDENDIKALIEDAENALKTIKILIFPIDSLTESVDYCIIDSDAQGQSMGQTPKPVETFGISQNQVKESPESRSELVLHAKKIVKKLTKSDLTLDKREQLETEFNRLQRDLTQDEIILIEKHRAKRMEKCAEKEAQRKNELKALLISLIHEQGLTKVTQNSSPQVANQEEAKTSAIQVPQMKKKYPAQVQEKAQMMKNIFAGSSIEELLDFVSKSPSAPLEQLVRNYVSH